MKTNKPAVRNSVELLTTVGSELSELLSNHGHSEAEMGLKNLSQRESLTPAQLTRASKLLSHLPHIYQYLLDWQDNYAQLKLKSNATHKEYLAAFKRFKSALPMLGSEFSSGSDLLDDLLDFFGVDDPNDITAAASTSAALFRQQNQAQVDPINLHAWLRRGELEFNKLSLPQFNPNAVEQWLNQRQWYSNLNSTNYFKNLPALFAQHGVALVLLPYLPKTIYGAVRWFNGHPLIQVSDRGNDLAACWFTLMHEIGHMLLHRDTPVLDGDLNTPKIERTRLERDANKFANQHLFGGDGLRKRVFDLKKNPSFWTPETLAAEFNVHPLMVNYWIRHAGLVNRAMGFHYIAFSVN